MQTSDVARAVTTQDGKAMLEVAGRPFFELNTVATAIWTELSEGLSTEQIVHHLMTRFDVPEERVARDVYSFVEMLKRNHLVKDSARTLDFHAEFLWNKGIAA